MVISAFNPVHSVFWLILAFTSASALFILLEVEFIALMFLIVYVGAIAILFLFVIMMLNLMDFEMGGDISNFLATGFLIGVVFLINCRVVLHLGRPSFYSFSWDFVGKTTNIEVIGRVLYTNYYYLFILASFILLVAMVGAIVLTHDRESIVSPSQLKRQTIFTQISRQLWG